MIKLVAASVFALASLGVSAAQAGNWNAYALDMTGAYGYAYGYDSYWQAENAALNSCYDFTSGDCTIVMSVESTCFALADTDEGGYWYGYAYASTKWYAQSLALDYCESNGYAGCVIRHSHCN